MVLLNAGLNNYLWVLGHCYFMQKECFRNTSQQFYGPLHLKCAEDRLNNLVHRSDGRTPYQTLASLDAVKIKLLIFTLLVHHVMCWMLVFNLDLKQFLNGNQGFEWASMLVDHCLMLQMFHLS
jgi:hypothetical protein